MPAGPIGSCWASGSWTDTCWEVDTWADVAALAFILDLNSRLYAFLQDFYSSTADLNTLGTRYLREQTSGDYNTRWRELVQDATDAMT